MLTIFLKDKVLPSQHGFVPGRGTLTAWVYILKNVISRSYIYECYLKEFFPSVSINSISDRLEELGLKKRWVYWLENIHRSMPDLPDNMLINEDRHIWTKQDKEEWKNNGNINRIKGFILKTLSFIF